MAAQGYRPVIVDELEPKSSGAQKSRLPHDRRRLGAHAVGAVLAMLTAYSAFWACVLEVRPELDMVRHRCNVQNGKGDEADVRRVVRHLGEEHHPSYEHEQRK